MYIHILQYTYNILHILHVYIYIYIHLYYIYYIYLQYTTQYVIISAWRGRGGARADDSRHSNSNDKNDNSTKI